MTVYLSVDGDVVKDVAFQGHGCAISTASASVMTETLKGKTREQAEDLFETFHDLVTGEAADADPERLGKLAVFAGVQRVPGAGQVRDASAGTRPAPRWKAVKSRYQQNRFHRTYRGLLVGRTACHTKKLRSRAMLKWS